jgi:phosphoglycerate dehydrogenase-like enzyme
LDRAAADALPDSVELVCFLGTGFQSNLDVEALKARNITACHTPYVNAQATAEFALSLLLIGLRKVMTGVRQIERCEWSPPLGNGVRHGKLGLVGFGHVGQELLKVLVAGFGARPLVWNRTPCNKAIEQAGGMPARLEEIFADCDAVSLHADIGIDDPPLIDASLLELARPDLVVVNTARGRLIDPTALRAALERHPSIQVLADVYPREPVCLEDDPLGLLGLGPERFLLTPHMGFSTRESARDAGVMLAENVAAALDDRPVPFPAAG